MCSHTAKDKNKVSPFAVRSEYLFWGRGALPWAQSGSGVYRHALGFGKLSLEFGSALGGSPATLF